MMQARHSFTGAAKSSYVSMMRLLSRVAVRSGLTAWLERRHDRGRRYHWASSLFAIYDIDALVQLDVPWWTYDAIAEVERHLAGRKAKVFEFGSGASTIWLAKRAAHVTSVEHDAEWCRLVDTKLGELDALCSVNLRLVEATVEMPSDPLYLSQKAGATGLSFENYARAIDAAEGVFDVIVIDGRARQACLHHAKSRLAPDGLIVFDNSHRARYRDAIGASRMSIRRFRGLAPALPYPDETTLMTARPNF